MSVLWPIYLFLREAGQFAPLVVLVIGYIAWKNDLKHIAADMTWIKKQLIDHLKWHAEN